MDVTQMSGQIQSQIGQAAKPGQDQVNQTLKQQGASLSEQAGSAQTKPTEAQGQASGQPPASGAAASTAGANSDPSAPRA